MTKSLTEKCKDGELEEGFYYILFASRFSEDYIAIDMFLQDEKDFMYSCFEDVKEVLSPVPTYDEYKQLVSNSDESFGKTEQLENDLPTEQVLNLQKMVEDECSRRCELETKCNQLEKELSRKTLQLEIATKALKKYAESDNWFEEDIHGEVWSFQKESKYPWRIGFKALKEMEGVK